MKKLFLVLGLLTLSAIVFAQKESGLRFPEMKKEPIEAQSQKVSKLSPMTSFLLIDIAKMNQQGSTVTKLSKAELIEKYALLEKDGRLYAKAFVRANGISQNELEEYGVLAKNSSRSIFTATIPVDQIKNLSQNSGVVHISIAEKAYPLMDSARAMTNVNQVHNGLGGLPKAYKGKSVIVGVVDIGLDYTHPNFFDSTGVNGYRIKRVWNQLDTGGSSPAGFSYGREYTTASQIQTVAKDRTSSAHGTHVAGIAAGSGGYDSSKYVGVAPKSDLVFVGTDATTVGLMEGVQYIQDYAASVGKPSVVNLSWGSHVGPHDGTSDFDLATDDFMVGDGKILVGACGNEGRPSNTIHLGKSFTASDTQAYTFVGFGGTLKSNGQAYADIWGEKGKNFHVSVHLYNAKVDTFEASLDMLYSASVDTSYDFKLVDKQATSDTTYIYLGTGIDPNNGKPRALLVLDNRFRPNNDSIYVVIEIRAVGTKTNMWATGAVFTDLGLTTPFENGDNNSTVGEIGGSGKSIISVGAYVSRNTWPTYLQGMQSVAATLRDKADFSSIGPMADGRTKPDIMAPGQTLVSSVNHFNTGYSANKTNTVDRVTDGTTNWWYGTNQGTSMAAPMVAGIIALWLEANPNLDPNQIKQILKATAIKDNFTGTIPSTGSNIWGWGKVNALAKINALVPPTPVITPQDTAFCANNLAMLEAPMGYADYEWNTGATTQFIMVDSSDSFRVRVTNNQGITSKWSEPAVVTVNPLPGSVSVSKFGDTLTSSSPSGNQWYKNDTLIVGATGRTYVVTSEGFYNAVVTNEFGCSRSSGTIYVNPENSQGIRDNNQPEGVKIYPNPVNDIVNIQFTKDAGNVVYELYDNVGRKVLTGTFTQIHVGQIQHVDVRQLSAGVYALKLLLQEQSRYVKLSIIR